MPSKVVLLILSRLETARAQWDEWETKKTKRRGSRNECCRNGMNAWDETYGRYQIRVLLINEYQRVDQSMVKVY